LKKGYILIETEVGTTRKVIERLKNIEGVKEVYAVTGPYDVIAVIEGEDLGTIGNILTNNIHSLPDVTRTVACLAIDN